MPEISLETPSFEWDQNLFFGYEGLFQGFGAEVDRKIAKVNWAIRRITRKRANAYAHIRPKYNMALRHLRLAGRYFWRSKFQRSKRIYMVAQRHCSIARSWERKGDSSRYW